VPWELDQLEAFIKPLSQNPALKIIKTPTAFFSHAARSTHFNYRTSLLSRELSKPLFRRVAVVGLASLGEVFEGMLATECEGNGE